MREITMELTTACSARCIMCVRANRINNCHHMDLESAKLYIQKLVDAKYDSLVLGGLGDPILYPQLEALLCWIRTNYPHLLVRISTTGACLNKKMYPILCDAVSTVKFSNYGFSKEIYEYVHGGSLVYEDVLQNIIDFIDFCHKQPKSPKIVMSFLDMPENHIDLNNWILFWERYPVYEINVWRAHNWGGGLGTHCEFQPSIICTRLKAHNCTIWVDGTVSACCFDTEKKLIIGNLQSDSFDQIYQKSDCILQLHTSGKLNEFDIVCRFCDQITDRTDALIYLEREEIIKDIRE